ncbi:chromosome segregation protein SMC [Aquifex aeolicus]|uniref:Chromosome partition protein Smc n=1 Tax=Aquifex aeolicus (strain VF5) TaxID=224324 RepID=SMC_AQUAE|nr:chromosome segregation protein SMC [Aquifex aeolicus]O66878.1 RecName: Full=Chromosome partition protein Smc [Aquifex aeolicus VF5]AAC06839.1 chromosome assembly protein homolog [Aquifex aeolicus VF5]
MEKRAYIEKIVVEGFKSYGTKRKEIPLGEGFIAVVGPNGAGKSNIGDAISFALGLSSAKALRAKNLSYLIFSKNGQKADHAYVEVHFKNLGAFPVEDEEVVISRKVSKDGRSIFKINGQVVRERDLKDFLAKAGIYETAYNVVYQGDIVKFLKMTPVERRKIIEEISGIGEYERKKEKALEELAEVELKIKEIDLILEEISNQLKRLKEEKEKLEKFKELQRIKRETEAKILLKEKEKLLKERERILNELSSLRESLEDITFQIQENEKELNERERLLKEVNEKIMPFKEKVGKFTAEIENAERSIKEKERELKESENRVKNLEELINNLLSDKENLEREVGTLQLELEKLKEEYKSLKEVEREKLRELEEEEERLKITFDEVKKLEEEKEKLTEKLNSLNKEKQELEIQRANLKNKIERIKEDINKLISEREEKIKEIKEKEQEIKRLKAIKKKEEEELRNLTQELNIYEKRLSEVRKKLEEVLKEKGAIEREVRSFSDVSDVFKDIKGVYGSVSELIRVKNPEHITAIEVAGGGRLKFIVVEDEEVAKECIQLAKRMNLGRFSFIPLNRVRVEERPLRYPRTKGAVDFAVNLVEYDPKFEKVVKFVFGDTLIVENFESAKAIGIGNYRMVTLEGELFEKSGVITGGAVKPSGELNKRYYEEELQRLNAEEEKLKNEESIIQKKIREIRNLISEKTALLKVSERKIEELSSEGLEQYEEKFKEKLENSKEYLKILEEKLLNVEDKLKELAEEIEYYEEKLNNLKLKEGDIKRHYSREGVEEKRREYSKVRKQVSEIEKSLNEIERELNKKTYELEYLEKEIQEKEREREYLTERIKSLKKEIENLILFKEKTLQEVKEAEVKVYDYIKQKEELEKEILNLKSKLGKLKIKEEELKEKIFEKEKNLKVLEEKIENLNEELKEYEDLKLGADEESIPKLKEKLKRVTEEIQKLGSVNFRAEEDYAEELKRFNDYKEKQQKLKEESKAIKKLIEETENKKRKVFLEAFNQINKSLKRIFSFLSPGGKAQMFLDNPEDPFSGGVQLTVKPRGKDVQYLEAMSGGEKTLAALSLIFALQEYKPSPFYYFDEVDAHLDEVNAKKVGELIREKSKEAQFIVVTLREVVTSFADKIVGVSARGGISEVFFLKNEGLEEIIKEA